MAGESPFWYWYMTGAFETRIQCHNVMASFFGRGGGDGRGGFANRTGLCEKM